MASLSPRADVAALATPRASRFLLAAGVDWAIVAATFALVAWLDHPVAYVLALVPLGSRQQALGALFHDAAHGLAARDKHLNDLLGGLLAAWPLGLTLGGYRRYHLAHHRHLGTPDDPEMGHKRALPHWRLPASPLRVALGFGSDLAFGGVPHLAYATHMTRPVRAWEVLALGGFWAAVLALFAWLGLVWVPILFVVGIATTFWSGVRLRIWTEHTGTLGTHRIGMPAWFAHVVMPHNIGLHWEHHLHPNVPFWNLGRLRRALDAAGGAPRVVPLSRLAADFFRAPPLASGERGDVLDGDRRATADELARGRREVRALRVLAHVLMPLLAGLFIYVTMREVLPRALAWFPYGGALVGRMPDWFVESAPDGLWAYACLSAVLILWDRRRTARAIWGALTFAIIVGAELLQAPGVMPGSFDARDLWFTVAGGALAVLLSPRGASWPPLPPRTE